MSEKTKETLKDILEWFPFYVLAKVSVHIFYEHALAGTIFTLVSMASYYVFMRAKYPEWNKKHVWMSVGFVTGILFVVMVLTK